MTEGASATFDRPQQRPYQERQLSPVERDRVERRMKSFPAGIGVIVDLLRDPRNFLGQRFAIGVGMFGSPRTPEEALIQAGNVLDFARSEFHQARTPDDLQGSFFHPVTDFDPAEIGRVHEEMERAKAGNGMDPTDTRFIGFIDASEAADGWTLGVVDTQQHTITRLTHHNEHGHY